MKHAGKLAAILSAAALTFSMLGLSACGTSRTMDVQQMIGKMTTEQKIEQMLIISLRTWADGGEDANVTTLNDTQKAFLKQHNFGGICLFASNIETTAQTAALTADIQKVSRRSKCGIPMLIATDQEGGKIYRLQNGTLTGGNMALGAAGEPKLTYDSAVLIGSELRALGINTDFAPDMDVNNNPANPVINIRSFSSDPELVSTLGAEFIKGLESQGVLSTAKHFPGHGDTATDSHTGLPLIDKSYAELQALELLPFRAAIASGVDLIMTAHIQFPQIENGTYTSKATGEEIGLPATLSRTIITDILRGDLGFDGVVSTDSMIMGAIQENYDPVDAAVLAINADVDLLLEPMEIGSAEDIARMEQYITDVAQQVENGTIAAETVDRSVERILTMKQERGILNEKSARSGDAEGIVGSVEHQKQALQIAGRGITLLKNDGDTLPLRPGENGKYAYFYLYDNVEQTMSLALDRLKRDGVIPGSVTAECRCFKGYTAAEFEDVIRSTDAVILAFEMYRLTDLEAAGEEKSEQAVFADALIELAHQNGKKVIFLSAQLPYDTARFQEADAILAAYCANGVTEVTADGKTYHSYGVNYPAALLTIFGGNAPTGKLPVDVYAIDAQTQYTDQILYPKGFGLSYAGES